MLKKGVPEVAVRHSMMRDKVDSSILDRDPNEEIEIEEEGAAPSKKKVKLCEHPVYSKYFNMLKKGLPETAVRHSMMRDKVDSSILDRDPNEEIEIEEEGAATAAPSKKEEEKEEKPRYDEIKVTPKTHKVALKEAPEYKQFFVMRERGVPLVQIKRFMKKNDLDPSIIDRDPQSLIEVEVDVIQSLSV